MSFQVGDLVVIQKKPNSTNRLHKILRVEKENSGYFVAPIHNELIMHMLGFMASPFYLRHATQAEIEAGYRIDHSVHKNEMIEQGRNASELEVLELKDLSPNCEVSEI